MTTSVLMLALAASATLTAPAAASAEEVRHIAWGAYTQPRGSESSQQAVQRLETLAGRRLDVVREFVLWDQTFPTSYEPWVQGGGRTLMISVKAMRGNGQPVLWRDIAAAQPGSALHDQMLGWVQRIRNLGAPVYLTLNHEPEAEASRSMGTDVEFKAAWQAWVTLFRDQGVTNVTFNWIMTDYSFQVPASDRRFAAKWYPGDAYVDTIAADAYNWFTCRPGINSAWKSLAQIVEAQRLFGLAHPGKGLWLAEYGGAEDHAQPDRKAQWFADAQALFAKPGYEQFVGVNLFERRPPQVCDWQSDSSAQASAAWVTWGADPLYGGNATPPPPPTGGKALLVVASPTALGTDATVRARVQGLGYTVDVVDDSAVTAAGTVSYDLVLISQSVTPSVIGSRLRDIPTPIVVWKPWLYGDFALTAPNAFGANGRTAITVTQPSHPLAAGLSGTVTVTTGSNPVGWGVTLPSAEVAATGVGGSAVFAYRPGAALYGGVIAPACRVGLPFSASGVPSMTAAGWSLFDTAVVWADTSC